MPERIERHGQSAVTWDDGTGEALYVAGQFTVAGCATVANIARWDGVSWSALGAGLSVGSQPQVLALAVFDDGSGSALYAGGSFTQAGGSPASRIARWDGSAWSALVGLDGEGTNGAVRALAVFDDGTGPALYLGGVFTQAGGNSAFRMARWDGTSWTPTGGVGGASDPAVNALVVYDDGTGPALYAGGSFTSPGSRIARWDGTSWSELGLGFGGFGGGATVIVNALAVFDGGSGPSLYAGGRFTQAGGNFATNIARWDGSSWFEVSAGVTGGSVTEVNALTTFDDGNGSALFVGGNFTPAGAATPASRIARWNGTVWSSLNGGGVNNLVYALAGFDDGSGPALFAGGMFSQAGGNTASRIARWDSSSWSSLGAVAISSVLALEVFDDGSGAALYAGGGFTQAGESQARRVARWDGTGWSSLGTGMNSPVFALAVFDDGNGPALYAGGDFTEAGGSPANNIARWDGASWSALDEGVIGQFFEGVNALAVFDDGNGAALYVGGYFLQAGWVSASSIARWDGASWSSVGGGVSDPDEEAFPAVFALAVFDDGSGPALYAGGSFKQAGPGSADRIARWDGSSWSVPGSGVNDRVRSLAAFDDGTGPALYVGGDFTVAGGSPASRIARWDGAAWSPLDAGTDGSVHALKAFDDASGSSLYAGGSFVQAGGNSVGGVGEWRGCVASPSCPGDLTGDGLVDADDLGVLLGAFGSSNAGDLTGDGITDADDLGILLGAFGTVCE